MKFKKIDEEKRVSAYSDILRSTKKASPLTLKAKRKDGSRSRFYLDKNMENKPMYKGELIIDRFLNN